MAPQLSWVRQVLVATHLPKALQTGSVRCHFCGQTSAQSHRCLALLVRVALQRAWWWPGKLEVLKKLSPNCSGSGSSHLHLHRQKVCVRVWNSGIQLGLRGLKRLEKINGFAHPGGNRAEHYRKSKL